MTIEHRLAMMRAPEYDPALDLIAVAPDGAFAAFCMCHISQQENARSGRNEGWTDPVGTRPEFGRRGLARALLLTGFHLLKQRGVETAVLSVSSENTAGRRAFASVGFHKQSTKISFAKQVREHLSGTSPRNTSSGLTAADPQTSERGKAGAVCKVTVSETRSRLTCTALGAILGKKQPWEGHPAISDSGNIDR